MSDADLIDQIELALYENTADPDLVALVRITAKALARQLKESGCLKGVDAGSDATGS